MNSRLRNKHNRLSVIWIIALYLFTAGYAFCKKDNAFKSTVDSEAKPWTNLKFYNDPQNFQFVIVSDRTGGLRKGIFPKAVDKINMLMPEFVMSVGDLIPGYTQDSLLIDKEWKEFNSIVENLNVPFFYLPGNHDITNKVMQKEWEKRYGKRYYSFVYKDVLFITLDSNDDKDYSITNQQKEFVIETLKENQNVRWTFLFMHHPVWKYDTQNRFQEIEDVLHNRQYTVFAGHEHRYFHNERNNNNYYILATAGGGSRLRGPHFGEFDHISWVTVTDDGPVFSNLQLDGIHPHDVSNKQTRKMAASLLENTSFENLVLCNKGNEFKNGSLYLYFKNDAAEALNIEMKFYHHHQVDITNAHINLVLPAKTDTVIQSEIHANQMTAYKDLDLLQFDWELSYSNNQDFEQHGQFDLPISPKINQDYLNPKLYAFVDSVIVYMDMPFHDLHSGFSLDNSIPDIKFKDSLVVKQNSTVQASLYNDNNQFASLAPVDFIKINLKNSTKNKAFKQGLRYRYYEGEWTKLPFFEKLVPKSSGVVKEFWKTDLFWTDGPQWREENFGIVYDGFFKIPQDGLYQFRSRGDDAVKVYIDDELVIDDDIPKNQNSNLGFLGLQKGYHKIKFEYMNQNGNERLRLWYKFKDGNWTMIPFNAYQYKE